MDPYSRQQQEINHYEYVENQRENYTDLTSHGNDSIKMFADVLFSKSIDDLPKDLTGILFDESMEMVNIHGALTELFLMGYDWLSNSELFDLKTSYDDIIFDLNKYFNLIGVKIVVNEVFDFTENYPLTSVNLYRDRDDYFCEITRKPPPFLQPDGFYVNEYRIITNGKFDFQNKSIEKFIIFFISKNKTIFRIHFEFKIVI